MNFIITFIISNILHVEKFNILYIKKFNILYKFNIQNIEIFIIIFIIISIFIDNFDDNFIIFRYFNSNMKFEYLEINNKSEKIKFLMIYEKIDKYII